MLLLRQGKTLPGCAADCKFGTSEKEFWKIREVEARSQARRSGASRE
jgi:hypothetical protein